MHRFSSQNELAAATLCKQLAVSTCHSKLLHLSLHVFKPRYVTQLTCKKSQNTLQSHEGQTCLSTHCQRESAAIDSLLEPPSSGHSRNCRLHFQPWRFLHDDVISLFDACSRPMTAEHYRE